MGIKPRTSKRIVDELTKILKIAKKEPPYILVGHSFGGLNMQFFARTKPEEVMGLILVDSIHAEQYKRFEEAGIEIPTMNTTRFLLGSKDQVTRGMPDEYKDDCSVKAYWNYYINDKHRVANSNETIKTKMYERETKETY